MEGWGDTAPGCFKSGFALRGGGLITFRVAHARADEEGTLRTLRAHRHELTDP